MFFVFRRRKGSRVFLEDGRLLVGGERVKFKVRFVREVAIIDF